MKEKSVRRKGRLNVKGERYEMRRELFFFFANATLLFWGVSLFETTTKKVIVCRVYQNGNVGGKFLTLPT